MVSVPFHEMPTAKMVVMLLKELRTILAVQLAWMHILVIFIDVLFGGLVMADFSFIVQK